MKKSIARNLFALVALTVLSLSIASCNEKQVPSPCQTLPSTESVTEIVPSTEKIVKAPQVHAQGLQVTGTRSGDCYRGADGGYYNWETTCNFNGGYPVYLGGGYNGNFRVYLVGGQRAYMRFYAYLWWNSVVPTFSTQVCRLDWGTSCTNPWPGANVGVQVWPDTQYSHTYIELRSY